jgi:hypothetical protein
LLNPRSGATEIVTAEVTLPSTAEAETGEADTLKSGLGGGGVLEPPPQLARTAKAESVQASFVIRNIRALCNEPAAFPVQRSAVGHRIVSVVVVECCVNPDVPTTVIV